MAPLRIVGGENPWIFAAVFAGCVALTGLLLATRPARTVLRSIRRPSEPNPLVPDRVPGA